MRLPDPRRSDFVLGMSLAELILLLLFAVFMAQVLRGEVLGGADPTLEIEKLREENAALRSRLASLEAKVQELERDVRAKDALIEQLRRMTGSQGSTLDDFKRALTTLKRGLPTCLENNTLVEASVKNRTMEVIILLDDAELRRFFEQHRLPLAKGMTLRENPEIDAFLAVVWRYETRKGQVCRFDYRMKYVTPEDYYLGRERLEKFFYPEKIVMVSQ